MHGHLAFTILVELVCLVELLSLLASESESSEARGDTKDWFVMDTCRWLGVLGVETLKGLLLPLSDPVLDLVPLAGDPVGLSTDTLLLALDAVLADDGVFFSGLMD